MRRFTIIGILALTLGTGLLAHPTAYKDAFVFDSLNSEDETALTLHYSILPKLSFGLHGMREQTTHAPSRYSLTSYTGLLLHRWNHEKFQANIYAYGGIGGTKIQDRNRLSFYAGSQADIEDRKWLLMGKFETMQILHQNDQYRYMGRLGFAPYEGESGEVHTWFMGQYDFKPEARHQHDLSPMLRIFYKNVLFEAGSGFRGNWKLNLMFHY